MTQGLWWQRPTALKRMRQPLEVAAAKGVWPDPKGWTQIVALSRKLIEPEVVSRIWLTKEAVNPLETLGRAALQQVAQKDLRLRLESDR